MSAGTMPESLTAMIFSFEKNFIIGSIFPNNVLCKNPILCIVYCVIHNIHIYSQRKIKKFRTALQKLVKYAIINLVKPE